jgi:hypothetical protein
MDVAVAGELAELVAHQHGRHRDRYAHAAAAIVRRWVWNQQQEAQLAEVQRDWEAELGRLLDDWRVVSAQHREQIRAQIIEAIDAGDLDALTAIAVDTAEGAARVGESMERLTGLAAQRMADEAADQGVNVDPVPGDMASLGPFGSVVAALLGQGLSVTAAREAIRVHTSTSTGQQVAQAVVEYLEGLSDATPRDLLGGALSNAQNAGRIATLRAAEDEDPGDRPVPAYYANETLDQNTCVNCEEIDGKWLGNSLDAVEEIYPNGGYRDCLGRERCRGTVVAVFRPETVDDF